jgi:hypothetical protein
LVKKKTVSTAPRKSDVIREIIKARPKATVKEIRAELQERKVQASDALINKIKYGRRAGSRKTAASKLASRNGAKHGHGSKAAAIRGAFAELGRSARARDVVATLASRGIKVSPAQVSTLRKSAPRRASAAGTSSAHSVSLAQLLAAKQLAEQLGGIEAAQKALDSLAQLTAR